MSHRRSTLLLVGLLAGCSLLTTGALELVATAEEAIATPEAPAQIEVTATNGGDARVRWGAGSSTCQLHLVVRVDGEDRYAPDRRICTADLRDHTLEPGQARSEVIPWDGLVQLRDGPSSVVRLPPGTYEVRGAAGRGATSGPVQVVLQD